MSPTLLAFTLAFLLLSITSAIELVFTFVIESGRYSKILHIFLNSAIARIAIAEWRL